MTEDDGRWQRILRPTRRFADAEVARMLAAAADLFDQRGEHDHADRLRARANQLDPKETA